ncbi:hypothetical protein CDD82_7721 [Ophiocordyceps australis]|uniref:DNA mismatch repair protein MutS connector domain-containing protein n=1 Tax=Ophiocordyceps australis TaxID=1399860 RepID=A0A2C5ZR00_9HYPO|nr:hypothetical protein CDD82_7721 [Ophiocordyceps australis]
MSIHSSLEPWVLTSARPPHLGSETMLQANTEASVASASGPRRNNTRRRQRQPTPSLSSTRPNLPCISSSGASARPNTASGRKSRTATSSILGMGEQQNIVCAVTESRGVTPSVGVAFVNVSLGEVILSQICDNQSYVRTIHKLQIASPSRIVFVSTACPPMGHSVLYALVQELVSEAHCDSFDRSAWSEHSGLDYIQTLAFPADVAPVKVALQGKYYAICSLAAVSICLILTLGTNAS